MKDVTHRASQMPPDSGLLYKSSPVGTSDPHSYIGVVRVLQPGLYWARLWPRTVNGEVVVELQLTPKR